MTIESIIMLVMEGIIVLLIAYEVYPIWKKRKSDNLLCDVCHKPRKLKQTWDKQLWVCKKCNELYLKEYKKEVPQ